MPIKRIQRDAIDFNTKDGPIRKPTALKVHDMAKMIAKGESKDKTIEKTMNKYGISYGRASDLYYEAVKFLLPKDENQFRQEIQALNVERLNRIVDECMESKNWKEATKAIAELNKMAGITSNGVKVGMRTDGDGNNEFIIQIG